MGNPLTPFDFGFELATEPKLESNDYNLDGSKCNQCPIRETCLLARKQHTGMCFEGLQKALTQTDVCQKVLNKEDVPKEEAALHLYIDSMLYHLDELTDAKTKPLDFFTLWDIRSDCALDITKSGHLTPKYAVVCRFFGRQAVDILRGRGYNL